MGIKFNINRRESVTDCRCPNGFQNACMLPGRLCPENIVNRASDYNLNAREK